MSKAGPRRTVLDLDNGCKIVSRGNEYLAGADVTVYNAKGKQIGYWECTEWKEDPEGVMGAILRCAAIG